jgi:protein gp37
MGDNSNIEWTDATWNPVRGCALVSAGCTNCYAMRVAHRFSGDSQPYAGLTKLTSHGPVWTGDVTLWPDVLDVPLRWRRPRRIFVNSMSDLFHEDVPEEFIDKVFAVMALSPQHTFQILTKRPVRMRDYLLTVQNDDKDFNRWSNAGVEITDSPCAVIDDADWPLPNVWLGVSVEDQATADERIPLLLQTPAAVRFLSCEPLLGPVDLKTIRIGTAATVWHSMPNIVRTNTVEPARR